jgi:hypothetical protein
LPSTDAATENLDDRLMTKATGAQWGHRVALDTTRGHRGPRGERAYGSRLSAGRCQADATASARPAEGGRRWLMRGGWTTGARIGDYGRIRCRDRSRLVQWALSVTCPGFAPDDAPFSHTIGLSLGPERAKPPGERPRRVGPR